MRAAAFLESEQAQGIGCILVGTFLLAINDAMIKWLSPYYPLHEVVLVRALVALVVTGAILQFEGGLAHLRTRRPALHFLRGLLINVANMAFFLGLATMALGEAMAIFFVAPLFITMLSVPVLGESVGLRRWMAVVAGLTGVMIMVRPGGATFQAAALLPLLAAFAYASTQVVTRRLGVTDKASSMSIYIQASFVVVSVTFGLVAGDGRFDTPGNTTLSFLLRAWTMPEAFHLAVMITTGVVVGFGHYFLAQAYRIAEASAVAPFEYASLPLAVLIGFYVWGDWPDWMAFAGIALIVGSGVFVFSREAAHNRPVAARRPLPPNR